MSERYYFTMTMDNPENATAPKDVSLNVTLPNPIIESGVGADLVWTGLDIDGRCIPIRYLQTRPWPENTDPGETIYGVTIGYLGEYSPTVYLQVIPSTFSSPIIRQFNETLPNQDLNDPFYYLYDYEKWRLMLETAIDLALSYLPIPGAPTCNVLYDPVTGLFSLSGDAAMTGSSDINDINNVQIFFNTPLANVMPSFCNTIKGYNRPDGCDNMLLIYDTGNNVVDGRCLLTQQYNGDATFQTCSRIYAISNTTRVLPQMNIINSEGDGVGNGLLSNVIAEFIVLKENVNGTVQSRIQFVPTGEYPRRTLDQNEPMKQIQVQFFWVGNRPRILRPLQNQPGNFSTTTYYIEKKVRF